MNLLQEWFETAKQVVFSPTQFFQQRQPEQDVMGLMKFATISLVISGVLTGLVAIAQNAILGGLTMEVWISPVAGILGGVLGGTLGILIGGGILHIFVYLLGGRGYMDTVNVAAYVTAIEAFFGWIPLVNIAAGLYGLYVQVRGIENIHNMSTGRAAAAVLLPVLIVLILAIGLYLWVATMTADLTTPTVPQTP